MMRILALLKRLVRKKEKEPTPKALDRSVREIQRKLMNAARENGRPRIGS